MYPNFRLFWRTTYRSLFHSQNTPAHLTRKRIIFLLLFYAVWPIGQLIHWCCFLLDDFLFPGHKTQRIEKPLFILGNLRSGSTFLHRLLSRDSETFTSLTIWDIYLTPSVTQKKLTQFFSRLDKKLGGHLHRLLYKFDRRTLGQIKIHRISFFQPEEDENILLDDFDQELERRGLRFVRYADDFVVLCQSREEADRVLAWVRQWTTEAGLSLHPTKTRIVNALDEGFDFLGWHFRGNKKWPRQKSLQKLQDKLRPLTGRTNGRSLSETIAKANLILRGWYGYFRESHPTGLSGPDGWLRRRLRALLRKREKRPGYGLSQADSRRWPNRWFAAQGLFSLEAGSCAYG